MSYAANMHKRPASLPVRAGLCLKHQHYQEILEHKPDVGWFEIHAENYLGQGGYPLHVLEQIRNDYALSIHGVGLSIGSSQGLDRTHLSRVADLVKRFEPHSFSEHLAWSTHTNQFYSDLLPVPYNAQVEDLICEHIDIIQSTMNRQLLLENPSNYLSLESSTRSESELLNNVVNRTGCGLLLDVNNVYISAHNMNYNAVDYIQSLPTQSVGEIHLAGHSVDISDPQEPLLIDTHDSEVAREVWDLYRATLDSCGATPTLIEWDSKVPSWRALSSEMHTADAVLAAYRASASADTRTHVNSLPDHATA